MNIADIYEFIARQKLGVLGSIAADGSPQSALVGIGVSNELEIIFDTVKSSRKFQNLVANPKCSFVIGWAGETTVQYEGHAHQPEGSELARYQQIYFTSWPDGPSRLSWTGITHFVVRPTWVRYSDFDRRPPFIQEFTFPAVA
jgi:pyridoxine/pyridoxamine 5'-phosphate oxidase